MIQILEINAFRNKGELIKDVLDDVFTDRDNTILCQALAAREQQTATLIYPGVSLPHVISSEISKTKIVFTILRNEIKNWDDENEDCKFCIFLLVKENESVENLKKVKTIVAMLADEDVCELLLKVESKQELERLLSTLEKEKNEC